MRLPVEWIKEYAPIEASTEEIASRLTMAGLEVEETSSSESGDVLDIKVTPNRGDCLSVVGVARELAASAGIALKAPPSQFSDDSEGLRRLVGVSIQSPEGCPRYSARMIRNIKAIPSPPWMHSRLTAAGMRPIGGIVDVTNYVMLEMGQPLHAFDFDRLRGPAIVVRFARNGETLTTLDSASRSLTSEMLLICDVERPVALAGVMGGGETEISSGTRTVLLESAHFNPTSVRNTSRGLDLRTEASYRFERFVDPECVVAASDRACALIAQLGMGEPEPGVVDEYAMPYEPRTIGIRPARVSKLMGFHISRHQMEDSLHRLGFSTAIADSETIHTEAPSWRPDIQREEDVVEEAGRVIGYEHIPERLPVGVSTHGGDSEIGRFHDRVRDFIVGAGLQEVVSHSLLAPSAFEDPRTETNRVGIRSALSTELSGLRRSLLSGLMDALERNARRGLTPLAFFEIGHVFSASGKQANESGRVGFVLSGPLAEASWLNRKSMEGADYFSGRGLIEALGVWLRIPRFGFAISDDPRLHPGRSASIHLDGGNIGYVGEIHLNLTKDMTVRGRIVAGELNLGLLWSAARTPDSYKPLSPFPSVTRDLAPRVASDIPYESVRTAVASVRIPFLERTLLTEIFEGPPIPEGTKSLTLSLTFRSWQSTLTDEQVNSALREIRSALEKLCGATFVG